MLNNTSRQVSVLTLWTQNKYRFNATLEGVVDGFQDRPFSRDYDKAFGETEPNKVFGVQISYESGRIIGKALAERYDVFPERALSPRGLYALAQSTRLTRSDINPKSSVKRS